MITTHHRDDFALNGGGFHWFHGVIEDVMDPLKLGRVRVRCIGYHTDDRGLLPTSGLPWALCLLPNTSASMAGVGQSATGLQAGSWVIGFFRDGLSGQDPIIMGSIASKINAKPDKSKGFSDPSGANPTKIGQDIPTEAAAGTKTAKATYARNISLSYIAPTYPMNQAFKTRSGHVIEYDDSPGKERISLLHKDGGFIELAPGGIINIAGGLINIVGSNIRSNCIQAGTVGSIGPGASLVVTFPLPMPTANYAVALTPNHAGYDYYGAFSRLHTVDGFTIKNPYGAELPGCDWIAVHY